MYECVGVLFLSCSPLTFLWVSFGCPLGGVVHLRHPYPCCSLYTLHGQPLLATHFRLVHILLLLLLLLLRLLLLLHPLSAPTSTSTPSIDAAMEPEVNLLLGTLNTLSEGITLSRQKPTRRTPSQTLAVTHLGPQIVDRNSRNECPTRCAIQTTESA